MALNRKQLLFGIASFIPGIKGRKVLSTGGTSSAAYCYSVWLRHLTTAYRKGLCARIPEVVAELGPGDSVGIGLAALISGASRYIGLDVVQHASSERNLVIFDELVELFRKRSDIPSGVEFSNVKPFLDDYAFPAEIFTSDHLSQVLAKERLENIRSSILNFNQKDSCIRYVAPWFSQDIDEQKSMDMIFSQAVMEYIPDYPQAYRLMHQWLKPGGFVSHQIDFKSHETADTWDGHWACSDFEWKLIRGKRTYFITRSTHSQHIQALESVGFNILCDQKFTLEPQTPRKNLNPRFRSLGQEDLTTAGALIQARKSI